MKLADAFLIGSGAPNRAIPSSPGRRVEFRQQHAVLATPADVLAVLHMADVQIEVIEGCEQQVVDVMNTCGTGVHSPQAVVKMAAPHFVLGEPGQYELTREQEPEPDEEGTKEPERMPNNHRLDCDCKICERIRANWTAPAGV